MGSQTWNPFVFMVRKHLDKRTESKAKNFPLYDRYENDAKSRKFALYLSNHEWNLAIPLMKEEQEDQTLRDKHDLAKEIRALLKWTIIPTIKKTTFATSFAPKPPMLPPIWSNSVFRLPKS